MSLIERFKIITREYEKKAAYGISYKWVYLVLLVFYPLLYFNYLGIKNYGDLSASLIDFVSKIGGVVWGGSIFLVVASHLRKNKFYSGTAVLIMAITALIIAPIEISTTYGGGELHFIIIQELLNVLWPVFVWLLAGYMLVDDTGEIIENKKKRDRTAYILAFPLLVAVFIGIPLTELISNDFTQYTLGLGNVFFSVLLVPLWFYTVVPFRHRNGEVITSESSSNTQSQAVDALNDTLQDKHFDKDEIKED